MINVDKRHIPALSLVLETYVEHEDLTVLFEVFDITAEWQGDWNWLKPSRQLIEQLDRGNHRTLLTELLDLADLANSRAIASTTFERRDFHYSMTPKIQELRKALAETGAPSELAVAEAKPFTAKSAMRDFLEQAQTPVLIVDPYVGVATLDCLRSVEQPIRLLTGTNPQAIEPGFGRALEAFIAEGFTIEVRQHSKLHDRHIVFNERCWLVGSSLKDAGKKSFHAMEIVDSKTQVVSDLETKWQIAAPFATEP